MTLVKPVATTILYDPADRCPSRVNYAAVAVVAGHYIAVEWRHRAPRPTLAVFADAVRAARLTLDKGFADGSDMDGRAVCVAKTGDPRTLFVASYAIDGFMWGVSDFERARPN